MEAVFAPSVHISTSPTSHHKTPLTKSRFQQRKSLKLLKKEEKFEWYAQWYPVMPVCDLDKRVPHAKKVMGLDLVVWWDRNESEWKCSYHGWCFNGSGNCKLIPQAPPDGPPVHTSMKACVAVYPSTVQHDIVWFWPNTDPQYKDIITRKQPPFIQEMDDPSFTKYMGNRDFPYGYDVLIENVLDPAHLPYAHYGLSDREGGGPIDLSVKKLDSQGFFENQDHFGDTKFIAPCISYASSSPGDAPETGSMQKRMAYVFICIPVSPGRSRLIWIFPRNFALWIDKVVPRWIFHLKYNLVFDSDLYLLHQQERKFMDVGPANWQKACFVPTKSDALLVGYRRWFNKYSGGQVDWKGKYCGALPPTSPREQLFDRYWSHVVNCRSCNAACKGLNALEVILQVASVAFMGVAAASKHNANTMVAVALVCFAGSRCLAHFIFKNFHYHDYSHAFR
ncbi:IRON-SULFUR DOMAIN CONTAINING PROTEIN [Salix viminalis]|uniref:IRON-SULFUR DOMAIN CONTAINING PROTEIN n=1 Tax=Salix viminalis TaxID=40686 RepID=A0A9Q0T6Z5_SALVM|nr:IRON-SULFUR DOMAIN CONTAINING PROTEIN [Salix viminalis]